MKRNVSFWSCIHLFLFYASAVSPCLASLYETILLLSCFDIPRLDANSKNQQRYKRALIMWRETLTPSCFDSNRTISITDLAMEWEQSYAYVNSLIFLIWQRIRINSAVFISDRIMEEIVIISVYCIMFSKNYYLYLYCFTYI